MSTKLLRMFVLIVALTFASVSGLLAEENQSPAAESVGSIESIPSQQSDEAKPLPEGSTEIEAQSAINESIGGEPLQLPEEPRSENQKD